MSTRGFHLPTNDAELAKVIEAKTSAPLPDFFSLLELNTDATPQEIRMAHDVLVKAFDPARLPPKLAPLAVKAQHLVMALNQAHDTLIDDEKRRAYLEALEKVHAHAPHHPAKPAPAHEERKKEEPAEKKPAAPAATFRPPGARRSRLPLAVALLVLALGAAAYVVVSMSGEKAPEYPFINPVGGQVSADEQTRGFLVAMPGGKVLPAQDLKLLEGSARRSGFAVKVLPEGKYRVFPDTPENRKALEEPAPAAQPQ